MGRVVVVGSINVDFVVRVARLPRGGETVTGGAFRRSGGGKGGNAAIAAARAGAAVTLVGAVGADDLGAEQLAELVAAGVDISRCARLEDHSTGIALIVVDSAGENQIAVASGANSALDGRAVAASLDGLPVTTGQVVLAGFELPDVAVEAALHWAAKRGAASVLNPAPARPVLDSILETHPILTPNAQEALSLTGEVDPERAARQLQSITRAPVVVTLGPRGALLLDLQGHATQVAALPVTAVDATGAGDTLNGFLAAELASHTPIEDAVRIAVAAASLSTTKPGSRAGIPSQKEVQVALTSRSRGAGSPSSRTRDASG